MARKGTATAVVAVGALLLGAVGYGTADAYDLVHGVLTTAPVPEPAAPFPTAPGAALPEAAIDIPPELDPAAPAPDAATVQSWATALVDDERMGTSTGVQVTDLLSGAVLAEVSPSTPRVPASTTKLLTAAAALSVLGAERTLPTTLVQIEPGSIVLVGGGDALLSAGQGDPTATVGHAGLADLAAQAARSLRLAGTTTVRLSIDDTLFSGPALHPDWVPSDIAAGYVAAVAPIEVDVAKTRSDEPYPTRYADPALQAALQLADALAAEGITVDGAPTRASATTASSVEIARVTSAPMSEIVAHLLEVSDNTLAEVVGRLVAVEMGLPGSFTGAATAVVQAVGRYIDVDGVTLRDCSGLSALSRIPADVLVDLVGAAVENPVLRDVALDVPVGGWTGTLDDRFLSGAARGLVRAKTGSLPGVTSLAGTVQTVDGRYLAFAVLADATPSGGQWAPRAAIDDFVGKLAACGCSG
ncbi:D-alanyl-D-alanine carboxypeptidase/D-alanyl-D-alanine-endopeptidase [Actinotalea sp.]|uniref:D-alanyl-D-alanine carboxypeptidase/D-alanyl-D-alanine endopeptidase n=1 Tax=Actinotalea sp. TaxID=1872145 RepID=UPI0035680134